MKLDLTDLKEGITVFNLEEEAKDLGFDGKDELQFKGPIVSDIEVDNMKIKVVVKGDIKAKAILNCSRCLGKFNYEINTKFDLIYAKDAVLKDGEVRKEYLDEQALTGNIINLDDDIRQTVILALPLQYLCKENCKGLCPNCGKNLNREKCNCSFKKENAFSRIKLNKK